MEIQYIEIGRYVHVNKEGIPHHKKEGKVLSIYSDYGLDSTITKIRLLLEDGYIVIGDLKASEISS